MRPVVGITAYAEPVSWGVWRGVPAAFVPHAYVRSIEAVGGRAVLLPPDDVDADVLRVLDALVLTGGADLDPARYGAEPARFTESQPGRDVGEVTLLTAAIAVDLPVLGVCRGMQLLAVAHGGRLHQHLPDVVGHPGHRPELGRYGAHDVHLAPGSLAASVLGNMCRVNSYHHQAVADPGRLTATGWADDGVIEAVEDPGRRFLLGVQWHPEQDDERPFAALVRAALDGCRGSG